MIDQGNDKKHHSREQRRTGGQAIEAVDEIEGVGDRNHPQYGERQSDEPGQRARTEDQRQIEDAHSSGKQHRRRNRLYGKLQVRAGAVKIVVDTQTKNQAGRNIDTKKSSRSKSLDEAGKYEGE